MNNTQFPKYLNTNSMERIGVNAVAQRIAQLGLIWRETPTADVGIDGQIEYVDLEGNATGEMVAVQIKSGISFFKTNKDNDFIFFPEEKHRFYWEQFPLPVLLILHNPEINLSYWVDVRQILKSPDKQDKAIIIPKDNILETVDRDSIFHTIVAKDNNFLSIKDVLNYLVHTQTTVSTPSVSISFLDLFSFGITNLARSLYFGSDLVLNIIDSKISLLEGNIRGFGMPEGDFLLSYINFLLNQHIANIDYSDIMIDWHDRQLIPTFMVSLTSRGRELIKLIDELESKYKKEKLLDDTDKYCVIQEAFVTLDFDRHSVNRLPIVNKFIELVKNDESDTVSK